MFQELSFKDLQLVKFISEEGSLTAAARRLHVSQPAASQRLAQIQQRLGCELFTRRDGLMRPTEFGERLVQATTKIDEELQRTQHDLLQLRKGHNTQLRIATQCYTSYRWLPYVLREMHAIHPTLNIDVLPEATESPYEALQNQEIDVALIFHQQPGYEFQEKTLFKDELFAVMHKDHALAERSYLNPQNFADQPLVLYTGSKHAIVEEVLKPANVVPGRIMQVRMTEAIVELVRAGHGMAILSGWAFDDIDHKDGLRAVRITQAGFVRQWLALAREPHTSLPMQSFINCLRKVGELINQQHWRKSIRRSGSLKNQL